MKNKSTPLESSGIKATDNISNKEFFFYTEQQQDVEVAMLIMGYGSRHYNLSLFSDRPSPMDSPAYSKL